MRANTIVEAPQRPVPGWTRANQRRQLLRRLTEVLADRAAPACFFAFLLAGKGFRLPGVIAEMQAADTSRLVQSLAATANYILVCLFLATLVALYAVRRTSLMKGSGRWNRPVALGATLLPSALAMSPITVADVSISLIASLLVAAGLAIALSGLCALRRCFGILPEVRGLVTGGVYRHVRHPIYLGEAVAGIGVTLPVLSPVTGFVLLVYLVFQRRRALWEEALLSEAFPQYREYSSRTRQFVPLCW